MRIAPAVLLIVLSLAPACAQREDSLASPVIPVLGHWTVTTEDGATVLTGDATRWDGQPPADIDALSRTLFGTSAPDPRFRVNVTSTGAFPQAVFTDITRFTEGTLRVDFKLIGGESDQTAGLVFDLQPTGDYLYVRYNTRDDNVALWRFADGQRQVIAHGTAHRRLELGAWHALVLTIRGRELRATAAGDLSVDFTLDRDVSGRVGVYTKRDSISAFRRWAVE